MAIEIAPPEPALPATRQSQRDQRALRRLCAWGGGAAIALAAVAITTQTQSGSERMQAAFEAPPARAAVAKAEATPPATEKDVETQRLEAQVRSLAADRDRLTARLASVEHNLDDVTGSIKRQAALAAAAPASAPMPAPTPQIASAPPVASIPVQPAVSAPASTGTGATLSDAAAAPAPDPVPLPPVRIASAPASEPAEPAPPTAPGKLEFGVDLGGAPTIDALRVRWVGVKANYGPLLAGLNPVAVRSHHPGIIDYRLVAGPLPNAAAAARLCAQFTAARAVCRPAKFDGERIAQR